MARTVGKLAVALHRTGAPFESSRPRCAVRVAPSSPSLRHAIVELSRRDRRSVVTSRHESSSSRRPFRFAPSGCRSVRVAPSVPSQRVAPSESRRPSRDVHVAPCGRAVVTFPSSSRRGAVAVTETRRRYRRAVTVRVSPSLRRHRAVVLSHRPRRAVVAPSSRRRHRRALAPSRSCCHRPAHARRRMRAAEQADAPAGACRPAHARRGAGRRAPRSRVAARLTRAET
jgi:hypothetical protein